MKRDLLAASLVGLLMLSVLATATLAFAYLQYMRQLRDLQVQMAIANRNRAMFQELAEKAVEYSKRNASMEKILQEVGIKTLPASDPSPAPSALK